MLTQERLKELFEYRPETGEFIRKVSRGRGKAGSVAGTSDKDGYIIIGIDRERYKAHRLAFLYMDGKIPEEVDHKNRITWDNRWDNLRDTTSSENNKNRTTYSNSGYLGVSWHKAAKNGKYKIKILIKNLCMVDYLIT